MKPTTGRHLAGLSSSKALLFMSTGLLILTLLTLPRITQAMESGGIRDAGIRDAGIKHAWELARESGSYAFSADIKQTTGPRPTVRNVGRASQTQTMHVEGETDLPNRQLHFTLWSQGGSVLNSASGVEVKVEGERAYARQGTKDWEEINNFTSLFAPQGDFMAFLSAAKDVTILEGDRLGPSSGPRYSFRIDGRSYAAYLRDQMEKNMAEQGELPPGVSLDLPEQYVDMTGQGELWLDTDGYPMRQILHLDFPPSAGEQDVHAEVTVDFSRFPKTTASAAPVPVTAVASAVSHSVSVLPFLLVGGALCAALVVHARSRRLYAGLAVFIIVSVILTPLLRSAQAAEFARQQTAKAEEAEARERESDMERTLRAVLTESDHRPNVDPLANEPFDASHLGSDALSIVGEPSLATANDDSGDNGGGDSADDDNDCDPDDPADTDEDGLTDGHECVLGTNHEVEDSDGDGVSDGDEIAGFEYDGKSWYADPLEMDTNDDGLGDGVEWNTGRGEGEVPPDTDDDGTPDLFDRDNDGDGVPDKLDLSPYYKGDTTFSEEDPFRLIVDDLEEGVPTFVEFQLRPMNPDHLWYAMNVLDWPEGDLQGQIQDEDGATFYDVDNNLDPNPNDNGDVKLVPMLEIKISGEPDDLPPAEECTNDDGDSFTCYPDLEPYGVFIQEFNEDGDKAAYVPLQLVVDRTGGEHVAFAGKMHYLPDAAWGSAHQVSLVWLVKALVDVCETYEDGRCVQYEEMNRTQVVHSYGDDWFLTGIDVREDHGADYDVIYEAPSVDDDLDDDSTLLYLTYGLERTFLSGSDCEDIDDKGTEDPDDDECIGGDGERDITVDEIYRRWNHPTNDGVSDNERWSLDDHLSVVTHTYKTMDGALATLAMTDTKEILDDTFTAYTPVTPTLLFAREERFRGANLDQHLDDDVDVVQWSDEDPHQLTLVLSQEDAPLDTVAGLNWAPFHYEDDAWEAYPIEAYWDELHERYTAAFTDEYSDDEDPGAARGGGVIVGQTHYLALYGGVSVTVKSGDELLTQRDYQTYDKPLWSVIAKAGGKAVVFVVNNIVMRSFYQSTLPLKALYTLMQRQRFGRFHNTMSEISRFGRAVKNKISRWLSSARGVKTLGVVSIAVIVALVVVIIAFSHLVKSYMANNPTAVKITAVLVGALLFGLTVLVPIFQAVNLIITVKAIKGLSTLAATSRVLRASSKFIGMSKAVGVVGLLIGAGIAWGIFIYALVTEDIPASSVAFDMLLAQTIAATIVAILVFALSLTIVGTIIVAIVTLIDIVLIILGSDWTITRWATDVITRAIFSYELAIDVEADDLVAMGALESAFVDPGDGMVEGAELEFSTTLTSTVTHQNPKDWRTRFYMWMYDEDQLRSTTFKYDLGPTSTSLSADLGDVSGEWNTSYDHKFWGRRMYSGWKNDSPSTVTALETGINSQVDLKLTSAFAVPGVECWTLIIIIPFPPIYIPVPVCFEKGVDDAGSEDVGPIVLDVLPPTLDAFVDVTAWTGGNTSLAFRDPDGDGLLASSHNGNDPDTTTWDADGDGLSDAWELDRSSIPADEGGQFYDPRDPDTDDDGLNDGDEARLSTNPNNADSDGDTIGDYSETKDGWTFTYAEGKSLRVYSDPLDADADGDGMDDLFERTLHTCPDCEPLENRFYPYVWNTSPIGLSTEIGDPNEVVRPTQTFPYTTTVTNELQPDLWVRGGTELDPALLTGGPLDMYFDIARDQSQSLYADLTVPSGAANQDVDLITTLEAQLHTPSVWAWDPRQSSSTGTATGAQPESVAMVPVDEWTVPYVAAVLESDQVYAYPASADGLTGAGVHVIGRSGDGSNAPPDVACTDEGLCLVVWSSYSTIENEDTFRWRRLSPTLQVEGDVSTVTAPAGEQTYGGAVGAGESDFLVAWAVGDAVSRTLVAGTINEYGTVSSPTLTLDQGAIGGMDVAHAFDRYHVVWERGGDLFAAEVYGAQVTTTTVAATADQEDQPRIAYDPLSQRSLIVYRRDTGNSSPYLHARTFAGGHVGKPATMSRAGRSDASLSPGISPDPKNGGWVVAWRPEFSENLDDSIILYQAVGMNGEMRGQRQSFWAGSRTPALDLGCARPRPVAKLLLDEGSGATEFADSSGFDNDGTCTDDGDYDCPLAGAGGKNGNGVRFDGAGDIDQVSVPMDASESAYAVTFWFKASCQTCGMFEVSNGHVPGTGDYGADRTVYLKNGDVCARLGVDKSERICSSAANYGDGQWHQVAHTFGGLVGGQRLYVDGELVASGQRDASDFTADDRLRIGYGDHAYGGAFEGVVDEVTFYPRALSEGEVRDAYRAPLIVYPFDEVEGATRFENAAENGYGASCENGACPTAGVAGRAYAAAEFDGADDTLIVGNQKRAVAEYVYDFEDVAGNGWSTTRRDSTPADARGFLGRFGDESVTLDLSNLPSHDEIEVSFDLYVIGSWDGNKTINDHGPDYWSWYANGERQLRTTFSNFSPPYDYQFYPDEPWTPSGVTLEGQAYSWLGPRTEWHFTQDEPNIDPDIDSLHVQTVRSDTVVQSYWFSNYGAWERSCDGKRYAEDGSACEDLGEPDSVRVWAAANPGGTGAVERNALGYDRDAVYHIEGSFDHIADTFQLRFEGDHLESLDNESWGLDNVRVRIINRNVPLTNQSFTAAFWARRDGDGSGYVIAQGETSANQGLHIGFRDDGRFTCAFHGDDLNSVVTSTDGEWHHWACTYDADTNERIIYQDGQPMAQDTADADYQGSGQLEIGRGLWDGTHAFRGRLDEVVIWPDPLSASEIESLYDKVKAMDDSVTECALPRARQNDARLHVDRLAVRETTTFLGTAEQETTDTITIDRTEPEASITSLANGDVLNTTGTLVIGGESRDNTFVTAVEVSIDGSAWQEAEGVETWTYSWDTAGLGEGDHTVRARAIDAGGNVETTPSSVTVNIDRTPPQMTADPPPQTAGQDGDGNWRVPLSGTVSDVNPDIVEVLLQGRGGAAAGFGWQPATVTGTSWSIDYRLADVDNDENALANPTGVYTLSLRAEDVPGNWTPETAYVPSVDLDNTAPETGLTFPLSDTVALTDTTRFITGVITDVGSVAHGVGDVEIAFVDSEQDSPVIDWQDALLAAPGTITSTWAYTLPADTEGFYEIYLRGTDVVDNRNDKGSTWQVWQGIVDTRDPYVDALADYGVMGTVTDIDSSDVVTYTDVTCEASDLTLDIDQFTGCPCDESTWQITTYDEVSSWYRDTFSDTTHIYQVDAHCLHLGEYITPPTVHAYDAAGRHSSTALSETVSIRLLDSAIFTPTGGTVLTTTDSFDVEGRAVAAPWQVGTVTVTVNGVVWQTYNYGGGLTQQWNDAFDPAVYNPPGDGRYRFLSVVREEYNPDGDREQTLLHPVTVTVDSLPPSTPTFTTTVFTTAHQAEAWPVFLTGVVTDLVGLDRVETDQDGEGWVRAAHDGTNWRARWTGDDSTSDHVTHTVSVRAVDLVSRTVQTTEDITFDVVPPEFVTMTMAARDATDPLSYHPIEPGQTITDTHTLRVTWPSSEDGAGVRGYYAGWTTVPTATAGLSYTMHTGATVYTATQVISEAEAVYAHVVPVDNHGNRREEAVGPIFVDSPFTPDYVAMGDGASAPYHGWMESACSLMGVDRRVETHALDGASLDEPQRFYTTWDEDALRLAWDGANWDYEGDLFVYFDTVPGGAKTLYNPYSATMTNTTIYLPGNLPPLDTSAWPAFEKVRQSQLVTPLLSTSMEADAVLWVQSSVTATMMRWDGSGWVSPTLLTADHYRWNAGITDLSLPFSATLGITQPATSPLSMLAVASEDDALRLWATMPDRNLVNSERVVNPTAALASRGETVFVLTRPYLWPSLGSGICPNDPLSALTGETFPDSELQVWLDAQPVGATYALMADDLYHEWRAFYQDEGPEQRQFDFLDHSHPPVGHGDRVTYTLQIDNRGSTDAFGVKTLFSAYYGLTLPDAVQDTDGYREYKVLDIGTIPAGTSVTATITGTVNVETNWRYDQCVLTHTVATCQPLREWATLQGQLFDERTPLTLTAGLPAEPPSEWVWADHQVDNAPPQHVGIVGPQAVVAPQLTSVRGYASDPSGVPLVDLAVRDESDVTTVLTCPDATPDDGRWACDWSVSGDDGDEFDLRVRATDGYGHVSGWTSPWRTVVLDSTPPTVTLDIEAREAISGQLIGPEGYLATGVFTDSHSPGDVEICHDTTEEVLCDGATVVLSAQAPTTTAHLYDDDPATPVSIGEMITGAACISRTFTVDDSFFAADVDLGFNAVISNREELIVDLFSPVGMGARLVDGLGNDANVYANYDVWLDDAAQGELHNRADDDPTTPFFDRAARPDHSLSVFNGEPVSGTWTLRVCDLLPLVDQGAYRRARLSLTPQSRALSSAGRWAYELPTPEGVDGVTQTLTIYSLDAMGNQLAEPISLTYQLDTVAPALTVTTAITEVHMAAARPVLSGTVSDGEGVEAIYLRVDPPDGASYRDATEVDGTDWSYRPRFTSPGTHKLWLEAYDRAGNVRVDGPYSVTAEYTGLQSLEIDGPTRVLTGTPATLEATYTPADATWVELLWHDGSTADSVTYVWPEGAYTAVVTATDAGDNVLTDTHTVNVVCPVVEDARIGGPTTALSGTAVTLDGYYTATEEITGGVTLEWDNGTFGERSVYTWTAGVHTAVLTATGSCGMPVTDAHTVSVTVTMTGPFKIYMPIIHRQH